MPLVLWRKLATDIFYFENYAYLTVVDYYSWFPVICKLDRMTAKHVTGHMQAIFLHFGWPDTLVSNNDSCYIATEFRQAMEDIGINHITSSPHYHKSNGLVEKYIQLVNSFLSQNQGDW